MSPGIRARLAMGLVVGASLLAVASPASACTPPTGCVCGYSTLNFVLAAGTLSREAEAMMLALDELDEREGTTKIECRIPPAFEQKLLKTIRDRVARHCAGDVVALNDLFRLLTQEIEREIAQAEGPPFVPHFTYLTEDRVRRMMDMSIAFQAQYRGEMPHHGFSEYFASVRKYSIILVMAASMFGMSSLMRQYREFTVPATIFLVLSGTYSVISSTRQQRGC